MRNILPGITPEVTSERTRVGDKDPKSLKSPWLGGTEYRDLGYKSYLESKVALKSDDWSEGGPITVKLASNVLAGEGILMVKQTEIEDLGMIGFQEEGNFLKDAGAASETMDHLIAGQDTTCKEQILLVTEVLDFR